MAEHSPLPWVVHAGPEYPRGTYCYITDGQSNLANEVDPVDAAYIVKACNAYPELVKALKSTQNALAMMVDQREFQVTNVAGAFATCVAAESVARTLLSKLEEV